MDQQSNNQAILELNQKIDALTLQVTYLAEETRLAGIPEGADREIAIGGQQLERLPDGLHARERVSGRDMFVGPRFVGP